MANIGDHKTKLFLKVLSAVLLILCLSGTVYFVRARTYHTFSSDEASEMVLGNLLASEGKLISENWYYSTELRVLNTNIFYSLFFHLTDSWHRVRLLSTVSMYFLLLLSYWGMSKVYRFRDYFALSAAVLFLPFSAVYFHIVLKGAYYLPYLIISILILVLSEEYAGSGGWKAYGLLGLSFILSVLVGAGGARQILILYFPLLLAAAVLYFFRKNDSGTGRWLFFCAVVFIGSVIGFLINIRILSGFYHFETWEDFSFIDLDFSRIAIVLRGFLSSFGYTGGKIFSAALLRNGICLAWVFFTAVSFLYALKERETVSSSYLRLALYLVFAAVVFIAFFAFTNTRYSERFDLPIIIFVLPLSVLFIDHLKERKNIALIFFSMLVLLTGVSGQIFYAQMWNYDPNEELKKVSSFLSSQDYRNGYASFWHANIITELSNGQIDVWSITDDSNDQAFLRVADIDQTYHWLQKISHDTTHPSGKLFLLFTAGEFQNNTWKENLKEENIIYRSSDYVILGYEDYEAMTAALYPGYDFVFGEEQWLENGRDRDGHRELYVGGVSYGPYRTFWPGNYEIIAEGSGLSDAEVYCIAGAGNKHFELTPAGRDDGKMQFDFDLPEKTSDMEVIVRNMSDDPDSAVILDALSIRRK